MISAARLVWPCAWSGSARERPRTNWSGYWLATSRRRSFANGARKSRPPGWMSLTTTPGTAMSASRIPRREFYPWSTLRASVFAVTLGNDLVVQTLPNSTKVGGLTEAWRIAWMAYEHNVQWVPHGWNTAIGLAADLHLSAAMPVARYVEYLTPSPYLDELMTQPFRPDAEGYLTVPDRPGLGIELNREALRHFGA